MRNLSGVSCLSIAIIGACGKDDNGSRGELTRDLAKLEGRSNPPELVEGGAV